MSRESRELVETEDGKVVRTPYRTACREYVLGWIVACAMVGLLFASIGIHELTTGRTEYTAYLLAQVSMLLGIALVSIHRYRPVEFYEWVET